MEHPESHEQFDPPSDTEVAPAEPIERSPEEEIQANRDRLDAIESQVSEGGALTPTDVRFLYQADGPVEGLTEDDGGRVRVLLKGRDMREDLSNAFQVPPERISLNVEDSYRHDIYHHQGDLRYGAVEYPEGVRYLPERVSGTLDLDSLRSGDGVRCPDFVGNNVYLDHLKSAEGIQLPTHVGGSLYLDRLRDAAGLKLPDYVGGTVHLKRLPEEERNKLREAHPGLRIE